MERLPDTRYSLILRLRDPADASAWSEFVALYEPLIYDLGRRQGLQEADARDLCQEVLLSVSRAIDRWHPDPVRGTFRGWLSRITRNLLVNFLSRQHHPRGSGATSVQDLLNAQPADDPSASALFEAEYRRRLFRWAADEIKGEFMLSTWQAFWRTAVEDRSPKAAAAELGLSIGAVYIARSRVLARFRERVEQLGDEATAIIQEVEHGVRTESM
jgi:RNA polymerase sigma-70 factor (ECF subfamily)